MKLFRKFFAQRRLAKMVERNRDSYETRRFRERRAAALKGRKSLASHREAAA